MAGNRTSATATAPASSGPVLQRAELQAIDAYIKNRLFGHWGANPGPSFTYVHPNWLTAP